MPPPFHPPTESNTKQGRAHRHRTASPDLASSTAATAAVRKVLSPTKGRPRKAAAAAAQAAQAAESALTDGVTSASQSLKAAVSSAGQRAVTSLGDTLRHATSAVTPRSATDMQVRIQQDVSDAENHDGSAKTHTHVDISLPKGSGADALDLPGDVEGIMEKAKAAIEAGKAQVVRSEAGAGAGGGRGRKRKADELDRGQQQQKEAAAEDEQEEGGDVERPRGKRARVDVEEELKVEKVKNRALLGLTGALALGYVSSSMGFPPSFALLLGRYAPV